MKIIRIEECRSCLFSQGFRCYYPAPHKLYTLDMPRLGINPDCPLEDEPERVDVTDVKQSVKDFLTYCCDAGFKGYTIGYDPEQDCEEELMCVSRTWDAENFDEMYDEWMRDKMKGKV